MSGRPGEALRRVERELERRFRTAVTRLTLAGREVVIMHPANSEELIDEDAFEKDERLPYWADLWPSARVLAEVVARMAGAGKALLELGCGSGLVATAAAIAGFEVHATDYYDDALRFTRLNVWRNAGVDPSTRHVDWRRLPKDLGRYDVVVASDVLYERPYAELVARAMEASIRPDGLILLADPGRLAMDDFLAQAKARGLALRNAERVRFAEDRIRQTITVYDLRPGPADSDH